MNAVYAINDGMVIAKRNLIKLKRVPDILVFVLVSPIMFVLVFAYVFGGTIQLPGISYREYLMAGVFAQAVIFGSTLTGSGLADDMQKGIIDRFRSLPMSRAAVVMGRTASDVLYNVLTLTIMALAGLLIGWRVRGSIIDALAGFGLLLLFAYSISWVMALLGLLVPSVEVLTNASFMVIFPLTFIANTFVPAENLPAVLKVVAEWNPISSLAHATRSLFGNIPPGTPEPTVWSLQNPVIYTIIWAGIIIAVFAPLAVRRYAIAAKKS